MADRVLDMVGVRERVVEIVGVTDGLASQIVEGLYNNSPEPVNDCAYSGPFTSPDTKLTSAYGANTVPSRRKPCIVSEVVLWKFHQMIDELKKNAPVSPSGPIVTPPLASASTLISTWLQVDDSVMDSVFVAAS